MFTTDQEAALNMISLGKNLFLSGEAGTGKSYVVKEVKRRIAVEHKNLMVMAPTGTAAVNVGGTTMHRALKLPIRLIIPDDYKKREKAPKTLRHADLVIVDEISMCRTDQFNYFGYMIELANKWRKKKHLPPVQLLLVGDFHQLPPVVTENDRAIYEASYGTEIGDGFAFASPYWERLAIETLVLRENVRQSGDTAMQEALTNIRHGDTAGIDYFNQNCLSASGENSIMVAAFRKKVDQINAVRLNALSGTLYQSHAALRMQNGEGDTLLTEQIPAENLLQLKEGARVMTTINDPEGNAWQNGSLGTVVRIEGTESHHMRKVTVRFDNGETHTISPYTWDIKNYSYNSDTKQLEETTIGSVSQFPLRLGFAITIHKSQGATFDDMTLDPYCFAKGQLYVALSRCRDATHLHLTKPIAERNLMTSMEVEAFYNDTSGEVIQESETDNTYMQEESSLQETERDSSETDYLSRW